MRDLLPAPLEQLALVEATYRAMRDGLVQLPPKPAIHPREDTFLHAMPAYLADVDVSALKWIGGSSRNRARGLPYLSGLIVINDSETAAPVAILDAAEITAARTAAVSCLCISRFATEDWTRVSIIGFGRQGRAHARLLQEMNADVELVVSGGSTHVADRLRATVIDDPREAIVGADVVITAIPFKRPAEPFVQRNWIQDHQLVVPIDFDAAVEPSVVTASDVFMVDDFATFEHYKELGQFVSWPQPTITLAEALADQLRPSRPVCCNLGVATLDAAFANHVYLRGRDTGKGVVLA